MRSRIQPRSSYLPQNVKLSREYWSLWYLKSSCLPVFFMAAWTKGRQTDGRTDSPYVLQNSVPVGAAALLPLDLNHILIQQGMGTADQLLPSRC